MNGSSSNNITRPLGVLIVLAGIFIFWALAAKLVDKAFLPGPVESLTSLANLAKRGTLFIHLGASLSRIFRALVWGFIPAAALGLAAGRSSGLNALVSPFISIFHPLPKAAFLPVIMLFLGLGEASKVFLLAFIIFSQILVAARDSSARVSPGYIDSVRSLGASRLGLIRHVIIPGVLPDLFTSLRVSLGTAVAVLFLAETFAASRGLGYLIIDAWTRIAYPEMYAAILSLSFLGLILFGLVDLAEKLLCPWNRP